MTTRNTLGNSVAASTVVVTMLAMLALMGLLMEARGARSHWVDDAFLITLVVFAGMWVVMVLLHNIVRAGSASQEGEPFRLTLPRRWWTTPVLWLATNIVIVVLSS